MKSIIKPNGSPGSPMTQMQETFREYARYNRRMLPEVVLHHAKEIIEACFLLTPRASPGEIKAKVESLGWHFKRAPGSYAKKFKGKGSASAVKANAERKRLFDMLNIKRKPRQKRGEAIAAALAANPEIGRQFQEAMRLTLAEQRYAAIQFRIGHIGAMASSWRPALRQLGSKMRAGGAENRIKMRPMCMAEIEQNGLVIVVTNEMPGIVGLIERTGFVDAAFIARKGDMQAYIARKRAERSNILNPSGSR